MTAASSYVRDLIEARKTLQKLRVSVREIACPADPEAPLHFADYDAETEALDCARCGRVATPELCDLLSAEMQRFEESFSALASAPSLTDDEDSVETVANRLFEAFSQDPAFAVDAAVGWGAYALSGRLSEAHLLLCVERALDRWAA